MNKPGTAGGLHSIHYSIKKFLTNGPIKSWQSMRRKNACKTCGLGMGGQNGGMVNEAGRFPEVCKKSLQAMASDMQPPIDTSLFKRWTIEDFAKLDARELDRLGRIPAPMLYRRGSDYFEVISWPQAIKKITHAIKKTDPKRAFFYFSGRSSNEAGFLLQLLARVFGTNHINNCSFYCHQASGVGLTKTIGSSTATIDLAALHASDLVILLGANPSSNHPRLLTSLVELRKNGGQVVVINPVKEPGLVRFKIPSMIKSMLFGSKISDHYLQPKIGGDYALLLGVAKCVIARGAQNQKFIDQATTGYEDFCRDVTSYSWEDIVESSGIAKEEIEKLADLYCHSEKVVFSWAMGITHHLQGTKTVALIANLAMLRGMVGRPNAGLLPLRGHSNIQGMGTVGVMPQLKRDLFKQLVSLGFKLPEFEGYHTMACIDAAHRGEMDFSWSLGGNLYGSNPDPSYAAAALQNIKFSVHLSTTLNIGHVNALAEETLILPVLARDEEKEATTQESMFSFVRLSDGGPARLRGLKSEVEIIAEVGAVLFGTDPIDWAGMKQHGNIRDIIAKTVTGMTALADIGTNKKEFTIPGRMLRQPNFKTPSGKAHFLRQEGRLLFKKGLRLMTARSEGQFNSVVFESDDHYRGIKGRNVILLNTNDIKKRGLVADQMVTISSATGSLCNIKVIAFDISESSALMYYPEANVLVGRELDPQSHTPSFKSVAIEIHP